MLLVVDTNVLFTSFWKNSIFHALLKTKQFTLTAPVYALEELSKYREEIKARAKISEAEFKCNLERLKESITFIEEKEYLPYFSEVKKSIIGFAEREREEMLLDIDFLALALTKNCPLWSNDKALKRLSSMRNLACSRTGFLTKQKAIIILTTEEVIKLIG